MNSNTDIPSVQVAYNVIKASKEPLTQPEIMQGMAKQGRKATSTIIYPLVEKGYIKKLTTEKMFEGKLRAAFIATDLTPEFSARRRQKRKYTKSNKLAIRSATDSPAEVVLTPEQIQQEGQRVMATTCNAVRSLQNTVVTVRFAELLQEHGPEHMLLMLTGIANMRH